MRHISVDDPLPAYEEPEGRWMKPYMRDKTNIWSVITRYPLTPSQVQFGLKSVISAENWERLTALMAEEDAKYEEFVAARRYGRPE